MEILLFLFNYAKPVYWGLILTEKKENNHIFNLKYDYVTLNVGVMIDKKEVIPECIFRIRIKEINKNEILLDFVQDFSKLHQVNNSLLSKDVNHNFFKIKNIQNIGIKSGVDYQVIVNSTDNDCDVSLLCTPILIGIFR